MKHQNQIKIDKVMMGEPSPQIFARSGAQNFVEHTFRGLENSRTADYRTRTRLTHIRRSLILL